jgi:alkylhydroperoxidase family enzyme
MQPMSRLPYAEIAPWISDRIAELGGRPLNLYRVIGNQPRMLKAWIDFAYELRSACETPRVLRELMILRTAQLARSTYEWHQHRIMASAAGVPEKKISELAMWRGSKAFDARERAALALTEAIVAGHVDDAVYEAAAGVFDHGEIIELVLTASFYVMVPRVLDAIAVTSEGEPEVEGHD